MQPIYGLTDRRVILVTPANPFAPVRIVALNSMYSIGVEMHDDGTGTVTCSSDAAGWWHPYPDQEDAPIEDQLFRHIENPEYVYSLLVDAVAARGQEIE